MAAANLLDAAGVCSSTMDVRYQAGTLLGNLQSFITAVIAVFPDDGTDGKRSVSDWIVVLRQIESSTTDNTNYVMFTQSVEAVFRFCLAAYTASIAVPQRITNAEAAAILAAFNAHLD